MLKVIKFKSKKRFLFTVEGMDIPGGIDMDFILVKAEDLVSAKAIIKSTLRHKRKLYKNGYKIVDVICIDDIKSDIFNIGGVYYQY